MRNRRSPRPRTATLLLSAVLIATPALTACNVYGTNRPYTPAVGTQDQDGEVNILNALVVSGEPGSGTFVASLSNTDQREGYTLSTLTGGTDVALEAGDFEPIALGRGGFVNLATDGGIALTGDFEAGDFVTVVLGFDHGQRTTIDVPVVTDDGYHEGLDVPAPTDSLPPAPETTETTETQ